MLHFPPNFPNPTTTFSENTSQTPISINPLPSVAKFGGRSFEVLDEHPHYSTALRNLSPIAITSDDDDFPQWNSSEPIQEMEEPEEERRILFIPPSTSLKLLPTFFPGFPIFSEASSPFLTSFHEFPKPLEPSSPQRKLSTSPLPFVDPAFFADQSMPTTELPPSFTYSQTPSEPIDPAAGKASAVKSKTTRAYFKRAHFTKTSNQRDKETVASATKKRKMDQEKLSERQKAEIRRMNNRKSAKLSRLKKTEFFNNLQESVHTLTQENQRLRDLVDKIQKEKKHLLKEKNHLLNLAGKLQEENESLKKIFY